ncbi:hypothetical protein LOTGIDRAFT_154926 [Lottia gigantea]|uniref:Uncharacterized protein n=1 Tax=Lottia gigantea TaxID=225164 RepID=V3Z458_LOTGI|nr:hypothetical protein LOTGIDRAFT_154926 [Lottia gigantea]ESO85433.1 hypothetical protein LOTGIDRAFT_154926 [Lottia gigantea]
MTRQPVGNKEEINMEFKSIICILVGFLFIATVTCLKSNHLLSDDEPNSIRTVSVLDALGEADDDDVSADNGLLAISEWFPRVVFGPSYKPDKRGSLMRFGKKASMLRFGKRGSLFRFGRNNPLPLYLQAPIRSEREDIPKTKKVPDSFHWGREAE